MSRPIYVACISCHIPDVKRIGCFGCEPHISNTIGVQNQGVWGINLMHLVISAWKVILLSLIGIQVVCIHFHFNTALIFSIQEGFITMFYRILKWHILVYQYTVFSISHSYSFDDYSKQTLWNSKQARRSTTLYKTTGKNHQILVVLNRRSLLYPLVSCWLSPPGYQQEWYWPCRQSYRFRIKIWYDGEFGTRPK